MRAIAFKGRVILAISERGRGVGWHVALGDAKDPQIDGRSHGKAMLLSWDKEARGFWPEFCQIMSEAMKEDPLAFKAQMEARRLELAAGPAAKGRARVRV